MASGIVVADCAEADDRIRAGALLVDARSLRQRGLRFLRGAIRIPWTDTRAGGLTSGLLPPAPTLAQQLFRAGIDWARPVVVVGAGPAGWGEGARVAWSLAWLDHPDVSWCPVLDRLPSERPSAVRPPTTPWTGRARSELRAPEGLDVPPDHVVLDVRAPEERAGARHFGEARGGHIPGARFLPLTDLWGPHGLTESEVVRQKAEAAGIHSHHHVVCVCTGGVRSAAAMVLLERAGVGASLRNHDGGMWGWSADPNRPMATTP